VGVLSRRLLAGVEEGSRQPLDTDIQELLAWLLQECGVPSFFMLSALLCTWQASSKLMWNVSTCMRSPLLSTPQGFPTEPSRPPQQPDERIATLQCTKSC
jgi:hypothetical protein